MSGVHVSVPLRARPQGSKRHVGGGRLLEMAGEPLKVYRKALGNEAAVAMRGRVPIVGPVGVAATFTIRRPKKHYTAKGLRDDAPRCCYPAQRGDVDKLLRSTLDALTGVVFVDDAQVVTVTGTVLWGDEDGTAVFVQPVEDAFDVWATGVAS